MSIEKFPVVEERNEGPQGPGPKSAIPPSPCETKEPYVLMVLGDSMEPEFNEGDVIVIEPEAHVKDGSYVIAFHNEDYTFRQLKVDGEHYVLQALKAGYPDEPLVNGLDDIRGVITQKKAKGGGRKGIKHYV